MYRYLNILFVITVSFLFSGCSSSDNGDGGIIPDDNSGPEYFLTTQITERIIFVDEQDQAQVNFLIVKGNGRNLLIDSGYDDYITPLSLLLQEINPGKVEFIINSHVDIDHLGGNSILDSSGTIIGDIQGRSEFIGSNSRAKRDLFSDTKNFQFDGINIECRELPLNGHTFSDIIIYFPDEKILMLGDEYLSEAFPSVSRFKSANVQNLLDNWDFIIANYPDAVTVVPGHGRFTSMEEFIAYTNTMKAATEEVKKYIDQGKTRNQAIADNILANWHFWSETIPELDEAWWIGAVYDSYE